MTAALNLPVGHGAVRLPERRSAKALLIKYSAMLKPRRRSGEPLGAGSFADAHRPRTLPVRPDENAGLRPPAYFYGRTRGRRDRGSDLGLEPDVAERHATRLRLKPDVARELILRR